MAERYGFRIEFIEPWYDPRLEQQFQGYFTLEGSLTRESSIFVRVHLHPEGTGFKENFYAHRGVHEEKYSTERISREQFLSEKLFERAALAYLETLADYLFQEEN